MSSSRKCVEGCPTGGVGSGCAIKRVFECYGGCYDEIPTEFIDALVAFNEMNVEKGVMRFAVYILWLKRHPNSLEEYLRVRDERFDLWRSCVYNIWRL